MVSEHLDLDAMTAEELAEFVNSIDEMALAADVYQESFWEFFLAAWHTIVPDELRVNWHMRYLCDELQACLTLWERKMPQQDTIINIPPGTTKSTIVTVMFPVWCWVRNPHMRIITGSYSSQISTGHAMKSRDILKSDWFQAHWPGLIEFKDDQDGKTHYMNTRGGERLATSTGGSVMGTHGHLLIWDDPLNVKQAASQDQRAAANMFVNDTLSTRKVDKELTFTIGVMQRLHQDDPTGKALRERPEEINHVCLPAEVSEAVYPPELAEYYVGGLLDPIRLSRAALKKQKATLGSAGYTGQFQQDPMQAGGNLLKSAWFRPMTWEKFQELYGDTHKVWDFDADTAYTDKQKNDPSALLATCYIGQYLFVRGVAEKWLEMPALLEFIPDFMRMYGRSVDSRLFVEPKASGKTTVQMLRTLSQINVVEAPSPSDDKTTRTNANSPFMEALRVVVLYGEPDTPQGWQDGFIAQCAAFPRGLHDDQLDTLNQAIDRVKNGTDDGFNWG